VSSTEPLASIEDFCSSVFRRLKQKLLQCVSPPPEEDTESAIKAERYHAEMALKKYREEVPALISDILPGYRPNIRIRAVTG